MKEMKSLGLNVEMIGGEDHHAINFDSVDLETKDSKNPIQSLIEQDEKQTESDDHDALTDIAADLQSLMSDDLLGNANSDTESLIGAAEVSSTDNGEGEEQ